MTRKSFTLFSLLVALISLSNLVKSQVYSATWLKGSSSADNLSVYGAPGIGANNNTPGARSGAANWKDASGNLWLFGGNGYDHMGTYGFLNDLWRYSPSTNQWTFMKGDSTEGQGGVYGTLGVGASTNKPGGRIAPTTWVDASGNFWMFGGFAVDGSSGVGEINDIWKYTVSTNEWTWMGGSSSNSDGGTYGTQGTAAPGNAPGARIASASWTDQSGNLWLHGGIGYSGTNYGDLHDLWKFSTSTNQWTWVKGTANVDVGGTYGTMGTAASGNLPGGRFGSSSWADASGNLWLFGGQGYDAAAMNEDALNDLWKYNIATNQWTWVGGSNSSMQSGTYGTQNVAASGNIPGGRFGASHWADGSGNLYMLGGNGYDANSGFPDVLNDLWKYSIATNQWTWLKGQNTNADAGDYGTKGVPSVNYHPSARLFSSHWVGSNNTLWVFGGNGVDSAQNFGDLNDLWVLETCVAPIVSVSPSSPTVCTGGTLNLTASGASTYSWSTNQTGSSTTITAMPSTTYILTGTTSTGCSNSATYTPNLLPSANLTLTPSSQPFCVGTPVILTASGANTYSWSNGVLSPSTAITATITGILTITCFPVSATTCVAPTTETLQFLSAPTVSASSSKTTICKGQSAILTANGAVSYSWATTPAVNNQSIAVSPTTSATYTVIGFGSNGCSSSFAIVQQVIDCTGLPENRNIYSLSLFPNPNKGSFYLSAETVPENSELIIYNAVGQQVLKQTVLSGQNQIDLQTPQGVYFYKIVSGNEQLKTGKIIVE